MAKTITVKCQSCQCPTRVDLQSNYSACIWCNAPCNTECKQLKQSEFCEKCNRNIGESICSVCSHGKSQGKNIKKVARTTEAVDYVKRAMLVGPYISWQHFNQDIIDFSDSIKGKGYDAVIGVPRSGMVVASQMSIRLGVPLYSLGEFGPIYLGGGLRVRRRNAELPQPKNALLVEDSTASGYSFKEAVGWMGDAMFEWNVKKAAIYATQSQLQNLNEWHRELELPHWFEWNLLWNKFVMENWKVGVDFDGILCPDFTPEQDDDGWRYLDAMKKARCLVPGGTHIYAIITARLEKYRPWTEDWLRKHDITYDHLIMGPWEDLEQRARFCLGSYKAEHCEKLDVGMFVESCPHQSHIIKSKRHQPVLCPALGGSIAK